MHKAKILITGSAGFIFSNFVRKMLYERQDITVVSIDKLVKPALANNIYINKDHSFYLGDIADEHFVNRVFEIERPEIVINGAAESFVDDAIKNPLPFIHSNVVGTQIMVNAAIRHKVSKFIQVSTDEVLGHLESENERPWTEEASLKPRNAYSASKASAEMIVQAAANTHGLSYCITRSSNNYGPRQTHEKFIPKIIKSILDGKKIPLYSKGEHIRDWLHVYDNCAAIIKVVDKGKPGEIYNISANQEFRNIEIVNTICDMMKYDKSNIEFVTDRLGHDFRYALNSSKLKELGWAPQFKFKDGITHTVKWYEANRFLLK